MLNYICIQEDSISIQKEIQPKVLLNEMITIFEVLTEEFFKSCICMKRLNDERFEYLDNNTDKIGEGSGNISLFDKF